ncbi:12914_t:CDS:2 [Dentiscutata heterogama]|uniref:12914_t:CDS:1 n=1 Tax=Dentiscutata heterogama TaxID=1316150 RepID=A0ACA9KAA8_9GLOM|nr:12914_t:CDS:2 [Dentiscutata heterogama]
MPSRKTNKRNLDSRFPEQINDNQSQLITDEENSDEFDNEMPDTHKKYKNLWFKDRCSIESPVVTEELYNLVKYWDVSGKTELIALFLDPQIKNLKFIDENVKRITINTIWRLCTEKECHQPLAEKILKNHKLTKLSSMLASNSAITTDLVLNLYNNEELDNAYEETKVDCYLYELIQKKKCDLLTWW